MEIKSVGLLSELPNHTRNGEMGVDDLIKTSNLVIFLVRMAIILLVLVLIYLYYKSKTRKKDNY